MNTPLVKSILIFFIILTVIVATFSFAILHHDDGDDRVQFSLIDHSGSRVTHKNYSGKYQVVYFGFTSCHYICPTQMNKLTQVLKGLEGTKTFNQIQPMFISVDPERDTPEKVNKYLTNFHENFVGLTGSRIALSSAAKSFNTLFEKAPEEPQEDDYQINHASVFYVVDPFNRVIDYIPYEETVEAMTKRLKDLI